MELKIQEKLAAAWVSKAFEPKIHHIRFPNFKNLDPSVKIEFNHPITAIVGANGTNKTSILRALQGSPQNQNLGKYWFGTALDSIPDKERNQFVYGRWSNSEKKIVEMTKLRIRYVNKKTNEIDPDYFEPQRPTEQAGMEPMPPANDPIAPDRTKDRWRLISKNVIYFDFRSEISAYDKCLFHNDYKSRAKDRGASTVDPMKRRKSLIRDNSLKLKSIFDRSLLTYKPGGKEWIVNPPRNLSKDVLNEISTVLGREYTKIETVRHRAFAVEGDTVRLHTSLHKYSEAWAGSGEFAVIQLVTTVMAAPNCSLIILDEPEVSLHPGAQKRLLDFLSKMSLLKKHQIVFATHSPSLISTLPENAIKVLELNEHTGKVELRQQSSKPDEAFLALGHDFTKKTIIVEDRLAQSIVEFALQKKHVKYLDLVSIKHFPGGSADLLTRDVPAWARHGMENVLLLLDGDERVETFDPNSVSPAELEARVSTIIGPAGLTNLSSDSNSDKAEIHRNLLAWSNKYIKFLPGGQPESLLRSWTCDNDDETCADVKSLSNSKTYWEERASVEFEHCRGGVSKGDLIFNEQLRALNRVDAELEDISQIVSIVEDFLK